MHTRDLFRRLCGAQLPGKPAGVFCRRSPLRGKNRCSRHGGTSCGPLGPRHPGAKKPGPKPRDPTITLRRKLRARLLRTDPGMVAVLDLPVRKDVPRGTPPADACPPADARPPADPRPPWPRDGYRGGKDARFLEGFERRFIKRLNELPGQSPYLPLSRAEVEKFCADLVHQEAILRPKGKGDGEACVARLQRLRWEADNYLVRLEVEEALAAYKAQERQRQELERARAFSALVVQAGQHAGAIRRGERIEVAGPTFLKGIASTGRRGV